MQNDVYYARIAYGVAKRSQIILFHKGQMLVFNYEEISP